MGVVRLEVIQVGIFRGSIVTSGKLFGGTLSGWKYSEVGDIRKELSVRELPIRVERKK